MPWVRLDDRFPSHRKVALLPDRAFRLYVSALCWSSENLTEGRITEKELPLVSRVRGIRRAAGELEDAGLWDRVDGGWEIHDYLVYNPDRAKVQAERAANAARQQAYRDRKRADKDASRNAPRNAVTPAASDAVDDTTDARRRHDDDTTARRTDRTKDASSQVDEIRNAVSNGTPSRPVPLSLSEKEKEEGQLATREGTNAVPVIGDRPRIPPNCQPLVAALGAAGLLGIGWDLSPNDWFLIEALILRCGIPALVASALASAQGARGRVRSGAYFLPAWRSLPDAPATGPDTPTLPAVHGAEVLALGRSRQQVETDDQFGRAMARAQQRMKEATS